MRFLDRPSELISRKGPAAIFEVTPSENATGSPKNPPHQRPPIPWSKRHNPMNLLGCTSDQGAMGDIQSFVQIPQGHENYAEVLGPPELKSMAKMFVRIQNVNS